MKLADFALGVLDHGEFPRFGIGEFRMRAGMAPLPTIFAALSAHCLIAAQ
jgi:hypothetical protein